MNIPDATVVEDHMQFCASSAFAVSASGNWHIKDKYQGFVKPAGKPGRRVMP
jgi:hypothetical protein